MSGCFSMFTTHFTGVFVTDSDPNFERRLSLVRSIHESDTMLVLALSGGGSLVLGDLLTVPGASRTLLEAAVPYSQESIQKYIGRVPDQYCSQRTARYLAMTAFHRGMEDLRARKQPNRFFDRKDRQPLDVSHEVEKEPELPAKAPEESSKKDADLEDFLPLIGLGCTASLATDREKKGEYRIHVAAQSLRRTVVFSLQLKKGARTRWEEERLMADLILNAIESIRFERTQTPPTSIFLPEGAGAPSLFSSEAGFGEISWNTFGFGTTDDYKVSGVLPLELQEGETILGKQTAGSPPLVDLFFGRTWAVLWREGKIRHFRLREELPTAQPPLFNPQAEYTQAIFPGSFNPIHQGHLEMIDIAEQRLGNRVALEVSVQNVDKPSLDFIELENRLAEIDRMRPGQAVWLTQTPLFEEKSELFRGATFVVGADTLRRFAELRFYHESTHQLHDVLRVIAYHNCRFLVFARDEGNGKVESLRTLDIPDMLRSLADEVPESEFQMNISSRNLRKNEF